MKIAMLVMGVVMSSASAQVAAHTVNSFSLTVAQGYPKAAALFGPEGEKMWAGPGWEPQFLYPQPARDVQGAVFTLAHGERTAVWVNTLFDVAARHFQYVYVVPEVQAVTIDVRFRPLDAEHTAVEVTYARTALSAEANEVVLTQGKKDAASGPEWQREIEAGLKAR